ncbi:MAG: MFS transporter [Microthrixaceae bacterium]
MGSTQPRDGVDAPAGSAPEGGPESPPIGDATRPPGGWKERVFGSSDFFALWVVQLVSAMGDWVGLFAITALAAQVSSQPEAATALVLTARVAPGLFLAPLAGVVVDRFDRKKVMLVSDVARAGVFMALPFVRTVPGLVLASLALEVFTMLWSPAKEAIVPGLVPRNKLTDANSLSLVAAYCTMPVAGGLIYGLTAANNALADISWLGPLQFRTDLGGSQSMAFYFNAASFLVAALLVWKLVHPKGQPPSESDRAVSIGQTIADIREGWTYIIENPVVRGVNVGLATGLFGGAMLVPLGPVFAEKVIGSGDTFSLFITSLGLGVAVGIGALWFVQKLMPKRASFLIAAYSSGISLIFAASMSSFWPAAAGVFVLGLCAGTVYVLGFTLLQTYTDDELRGRIFSTLLTLVRMCVLVALLLGPVLAALFETLTSSVFELNAEGIPEAQLGGFSLAVPGVRVALWVGGLIVMAAAALATRSMGFHLREGLADVRAQLRASGARPEFSAELSREELAASVEAGADRQSPRPRPVPSLPGLPGGAVKTGPDDGDRRTP